jgi:hypothetical protein
VTLSRFGDDFMIFFTSYCGVSLQCKTLSGLNNTSLTVILFVQCQIYNVLEKQLLLILGSIFPVYFPGYASRIDSTRVDLSSNISRKSLLGFTPLTGNPSYNVILTRFDIAPHIIKLCRLPSMTWPPATVAADHTNYQVDIGYLLFSF